MEKTALLTARSILASSREDFAAFYRLVGYSVAEPPWFAIPVDADEDRDSYTVVLDMGGRGEADVDVQATERSLVVWGAAWRDRRETRFCLLPEPIDPKSLELAPMGEVLALYARKMHRGRSKGRQAAR